MTIPNIRQNLENIDYDRKNPKTYLVFVPGLSLVIQKIQMAKVLPLPEFQANNKCEFKHNKFFDICKWHLRGSAVQCAALSIAIKTLALPIFSYITLVSLFELGDTAIKALKNDATFTELQPNGSKKQIHRSALNLF